MEKELCDARYKRMDEITKTAEKRLNNHTERLDVIEQTLVGIQKDTSRLEEILTRLEVAVDLLSKSIEGLRMKPLQKYEQILMMAVSAIVGYVMSKIIGGM